jgi:hypothetical protein
MNVIMEGTRRIDEWIEIQKVLPPDDVLLQIVKNPKAAREELTMSMDEFRMLSLINGERTLPELIDMSPMGEFVTCRAIYRLILNNLVEVSGQREVEGAEKEDEEEVVFSIIFSLYSSCFHKIRCRVAEMVGDGNSRFSEFAAQYRKDLLNFFPGVDPGSDLVPAFDRFLAAVRAVPLATRFHILMSGLERMLCEQLIFVYQLLGAGVYRDTTTRVKKEISGPLAVRRELVKRYGIEQSFYGACKRADKAVKLMRG